MNFRRHVQDEGAWIPMIPLVTAALLLLGLFAGGMAFFPATDGDDDEVVREGGRRAGVDRYRMAARGEDVREEGVRADGVQAEGVVAPERVVTNATPRKRVAGERGTGGD